MCGEKAYGELDDGIAQDHPRVCGEKVGFSRNDVRPAGSPPRVRGEVALAS